MINQIILKGRVHNIREFKEFILLTISIKNSYKNSIGGYDYIHFYVYIKKGSIKDEVIKNINKNKIIGIEGHFDDIIYNYTTDIICDKITYLSSKKED